MTNVSNLTKPEQLHDLTLRLEHAELRNNLEDMLLALHCYTKGYRKFLELIGEQIEPNVESVFQFEHVERGSIKLKNKIGYKPSIVNYIGYLLTKILAKDITEDNLLDKVEEVELETANFINTSAPHHDLLEKAEPYIDPIAFAEIMNDFSNGGKLLQPEEHFEVCDSTSDNISTNVIKFNRAFRSHVSITELKKAKPVHFDGDDTFIAIKPCNVGDGSWYVKSTITKRKFYVRIQDAQWLLDYQSGRIPVVRANDLITANLVCDILENKSGTARNVNAYVTKVHKIEKGSFLTLENQTKLF